MEVMMKKFRDFLMKSIVPASVLFFAVVLSVCPTGCRSTFEEDDDAPFIPVDFAVPKLIEVSPNHFVACHLYDKKEN